MMLANSSSSSSVASSASTLSMAAPQRASPSPTAGSVAAYESAQIKLTRYSTLPAEEGSARLVAAAAAAAAAEVAAAQCGAGKPGHLSNKLWTIALRDEQAGASPPADQLQQQQQQQPFQIVWRQLAFEVRLSAYDKLLNKTYSCLRALGGQSSRRHRSHEHKQLEAGVGPSLWARTGSRTENSKRTIFENLNGYVNSGELTAILGPSGSGKTSLLNALCGRTDNYRGQMRLVGGGGGGGGGASDCGANQRRRMRLSIIPQKDYLIENLTVRENLLYSSRILNPEPGHDHEAGVARVVHMLNLAACYHSSAANISGGEYKRVSIAQELLRQPDILILDEPTSGLDSLNCKKLIRSLVQLVQASRAGGGGGGGGGGVNACDNQTTTGGCARSLRPIAVVMTIHQPDVEVFHMFDHIYCMARAGRVIFDGRPRDALAHLRAHSGIAQLTTSAAADAAAASTINPANLLIEIASEDLYGQEPIERLARVQRKQMEQVPAPSGQTRASLSASLSSEESFEGASSGASAVASADAATGSRRLVRDKRLSVKNDPAGNFWYYTRVLAQRSFKSSLRDPLMTLITLLFHLAIPFVMYTVYPRRIGTIHGCPVIQHELDIVSMASNRTADKLEDLHEQVVGTLECSTMFFLTTYSFSMCSLTVSALAFPLNMHVLLKEVRNGWYNLPAYVLAKTLANFPFEVLFPVASLVMIYALLDMPSAPYEWRMWTMALVMALVSMISHTQGLIFGALCMDSVQTAIFLASASTLPQALLSGFTARIRFMPLLLQRLSWLSQYRYSSDLINMVRFGFGICPCAPATNDYLRTQAPEFRDMPANLKPVFIYYLMSNSADPSLSSSSSSSSSPSGPATNGTTMALAGPQTTTTNSTTGLELIAALPPPPPPGVDASVMLSPLERYALLKRMDAGEVDLFANMAGMISRAFSFGRRLEGCPSVRSQILASSGAPSDELLPLVFAGMLGLLLAYKLVLFIAVKCKIGARL